MPPGADHVWGNPFDDPATVLVAIRPALKMETVFETYFGLASDGKVDPKTQMPSFLQMVLMAHEYRDEITLPGVAGVDARRGGALSWHLLLGHVAIARATRNTAIQTRLRLATHYRPSRGISQFRCE